MATKPWAIGLVILATALTSAGSILYKLGADRLDFNNFTILSLITNYWLILGVLAYFGGFFVLLYALKGGELSVLYPFIATSYIWVALVSVPLFHEVVNRWTWVGIGFIIIGVISIGLGSKS